MRPIIAFTADTLTEPMTAVNDQFADMAPRPLKNAVLAAGGAPLILPFPDDTHLAAEMAAAYVATFDALLLPGGPDVDPTFYGEEPRPEIGRTVYPKDCFELALIKATLAAHKPIMAICRGMQILNVAMGGTLYQDLPSQDPHASLRHAQAAAGQYPTHHVIMKADSSLVGMIGQRAYVNSRHHEAVKDVASGLKVAATAPDGVIEALEDPAHAQILAVQWHPENLWEADRAQLAPFKQLIERAQAGHVAATTAVSA
ncbi:MAG: gamma-glutamyl-gamma-aminobutyrate hydrolase family protein [Lactobacillus sp.]|jgi:putative glutamine amidotransferase|uniref:Gamma-glutamyl-gamma-aminobutyrate hydrolase family protein n=1 Tax=Lacticaseibacillus suilingensis TaxID=2799577 RepID=A0ABW4BH70_9LACO|nr:gamma-glutamyl-gamma-aminobutyrate hydrolase family protein [Lacticaseibacillus suilingensis]MCI1894558.1 gamma-glutamyl-gamma-aminobutyrate hydrolase family protein [Lactobacillus sp.]MCI1917685.1 gamma-glutamyl-gamma-aminobutyrate hydrolase family protein [Lactobacillus sp.]MCI1942240.1 gamma-glutamyl-gamma-aminobutyrate hydrolase family protein [Lactobacillus sp.]MCI1972718.1 gamma-glutamyl-gamma-aminobutyrate hydrolase family protein [Lactobacillus sp.]MCI2016770.1 gamma-glutamyl-gamma-